MDGNIKKVYQAFINAGFSDKQAKALTAEVGRENAYQSKYIFGHHTDMANSADNLGFFSWQGDRKKNLLKKLQQKGLYSDGRIKEGQEALNTMAEFAKEEMQNISSYKKTKEGFLNNPNVSQKEAAELLGRNYLRWDMDGKYIKNVAEHKKRRDNFYNQISGQPVVETSQESYASKEVPVKQPNNFTIEGNSGSLSTAGEYKEPKEVQQAKQELVQAQNEENFLEDLSKLLSTQQQVTEEQYQPNYLQQSELFQIQPVQGIQYQEQQPFMYAQDGGQKEDYEWLKSWYQNRVIPNKDIQNLYEEDKDFYNTRMQTPPNVKNVPLIADTPEITGRYDGENILMTPNASDNVYLHELTHYSDYFPSAMRTVHGEIVKYNVAPKEQTQGIYNEKYNYFTDPDEVHARIQVFRKKAGIKPDQNVTPEFLNKFLKNYKGEDENINDLLNVTNEQGLLEMLNYMAVNSKKQESNLRLVKDGGVIKDDNGYWNPNNWGKTVEINSPYITMEGVNQPLIGISKQTGEQKIMQPGKKYFFKDTNQVIEKPYDNFQIGGEFIEIDRGDGKIETINTDSDEYRQLYNEGRVLGVEGDTLLANPLPEITLTGLRGSNFVGQEIDTSNINIKNINDKEILEGFSKESSFKLEDRNVTEDKRLMEEFDKELKETQKKLIEEKNNKREDLDVKEDSVIEKVNPKNEKEVLEVQKMLASKGYNLNPEGKFKNEGIDGKLGKVTQSAIDQYNNSLGQPNYTSYKKGIGFLGDCTEKQCSEFVQNENFRNLKPNIPRQKFNELTGLRGDAWTIGKNIVKAGGEKVPTDKVKEGDVITLFTGGSSPYLEQAKKAGTDATHTAIVDQVNPDGSYYVLHNVHETDYTQTALKGSLQFKGKEYRDLVKDGKIITPDNKRGFTVREGYRPNYKEVEDFEKKVKVRDDVSLVVDQNKLDKLGSFNKSYTGADINSNINTYLTSLNDTEVKKTIALKHGLSESDYQSISKVALGILGQETSFGTSDKAGVKRVGAEIREAFGGKEASRGDAQIKFETNYGNSDLTELGINKDNFTDKQNIPLVVVDILSNHYKYYLKKGESKDKALYKALEKYNKGRSTKYSENYDSDYVNKVLNFADYFDVKDKKGQSYKTIQDELATKDNVVKRKVRNNF
jgi:hypothetical protein